MVVTAVVEVVTAPELVADVAAVSSPLRHAPANRLAMTTTAPSLLMFEHMPVRRGRGPNGSLTS